MSEDIQVWLKQAERDFKSANNSFKSGDYYVTALLVQQSIEKSLKFLYIKKNKTLIRIHDLVKLAREISASEEIIKLCAFINPIYTEVRYPESSELPASKVNKNEAEQMLGYAFIIIKWVKKQI